MEPLHPRLRRALLNDQSYQSQKFTFTKDVAESAPLSYISDFFGTGGATIHAPEGLTNASLKIQKSNDGATWENVKDQNGALVTVSAGQSTHLANTDFSFLRLRGDKDEAEERTFVVEKPKLTPAKLRSYESLVAQLFYQENYPAPAGVPPPPQILREAIIAFHDRYMPNFDKIHDEWLARQKRAISGNYFDVSSGSGQSPLPGIPEGIVNLVICLILFLRAGFLATARFAIGKGKRYQDWHDNFKDGILQNQLNCISIHTYARIRNMIKPK